VLQNIQAIPANQTVADKKKQCKQSYTVFKLNLLQSLTKISFESGGASCLSEIE